MIVGAASIFDQKTRWIGVTRSMCMLGAYCLMHSGLVHGDVNRMLYFRCLSSSTLRVAISGFGSGPDPNPKYSNSKSRPEPDPKPE